MCSENVLTTTPKLASGKGNDPTSSDPKLHPVGHAGLGHERGRPLDHFGRGIDTLYVDIRRKLGELCGQAALAQARPGLLPPA